MRIAIYARYSTDKQAESSLCDQYRLCETKTPEGVIVARHGDDGVSGSTPVDRRPGGRALLADAMAGRFDVLLLESLDRLSRDQVELERTVRRLEHRGIRILGVSDGYDSAAAGRKVIRAVRGIVAELFLDDLRAKTHRGLVGKMARDYSPGGRSYGYHSVPDLASDGQTVLGYRMAIDPAQAERVRWIFQRYALDGWSVQRIAHQLNADGVPGPRSGSWSVSCLFGSSARGLGLLNNELYIGRHIWNRSQWVKDPDTGKRTRLDRPPEEWHVRDRPDLRIVPDDLWQATRARMSNPRRAGGRGKGPPARTLFGGLLRCGHCGGAVTAIDGRQYGCVARKDRGPTVCTGVRVSREALDRRLLSMIRDDLASPEAMIELQTAVQRLVRDADAQRRKTAEQARSRALEVDRKIANLVAALSAAGHSDALLAALRAAEQERAALDTPIGPAPDRDVGRALARYRQMLADLQGALSTDRDRARQLLADIMGPVRLEQQGEQVWAALETKEPAQLMIAAGSLLGSVAGARNCTRMRIV